MRLLVLLLLLLLGGCSASTDAGPAPDDPSPREVSSSAASPSEGAEPGSPSPTVERTERVAPDDLAVAHAARAVRHLAGRIGPRHGTSDAYRRAVRWVAGELRSSGLRVRLERFPVPAGDSWGVPVAAGRSANVLAAPPGFDPAAPHLVVGAHLDTVPQAPGAEDNASGVGVLLAVARALEGRATRLPVLLVAFGAEEPRGPGDDDHHYGSRHHVAQLDDVRGRAVRGMVSLDRVGVGGVLPVCSARGPDPLRRDLLVAARRAGVRTVGCTDNRASDHWSFVRAGLPGVRLGSTPYAGYHSAADVPEVVEVAQLRRAGRTVLAWVGGPPTRD